MRGSDVVSEVYIGPSFSSLSGTTYAGLGVGGGGVLTFARTPLGSIELRGSFMPVFGTDVDRAFTITHTHVPVLLAISLLEAPSNRQGRGLGGAIGLGMIATIGQFHTSVAVQPSAMVELTLGVFRRGVFTVRYQTTISDEPGLRGPVGYHSVLFIASTVL